MAPQDALIVREQAEPDHAVVPYSAEDLSRPKAGPLNPFKDESNVLKRKSVPTGHAEETFLSEHTFRSKHRAIERRGGPEREYQTNAQQKAEAARIRAGRESKGSATIAEGPGSYVGPWARYKKAEYEIVGEDEELASDEEYEIVEEEEEVVESGTVVKAPTKALEQRKEAEEMGDETTTFHGSAEYDYQGRTYMHVPQDLDIDLQKEVGSVTNYIPKKQIHSWKNHSKAVTGGEIGELLGQSSSNLAVSLELHQKSISEAVDSYISYRVRQLSDRMKLKDKVARQVYGYLSEHAHGTFLWVALVCQQLERCRPWEMSNSLRRFPKGLNQLYARMMARIRKSDSSELYIRLLAIAITVFRPITFSELLAMEDLRLDEDMLPDVVAECGSFLTTKEDTIVLIHQSAKDFLLTESSILLFQSGLAQHHYNLFERCITTLKSLHKDMYRLVYPGISLGEAFKNCPEPDPLDDLKYACVFWMNHLQESYRLLTQDGRESEFLGIEAAYNFIAEKFLFWMEALSLCQNLSPANLQPDQIALAEDALRFFYFFSPVIKDYPLQTYASGLLFSPKESLIRHRFEKYTPDIFAKVPEIDDHWSPILRFFDYHENATRIRTMKFSPTSQILVAVTLRSETMIWKVSEDPVPEITKYENTELPTPSADGKWLVSIATEHLDETQEPVLQVHDLSLNRTIWTRELGNRKVQSMEISPDSESLAVLFHEELEIYDLKEDRSQVWPLKLDHQYHCSMAFSSDRALVAFTTVSRSVPIQVLDLRTDGGTPYVWHVLKQKYERWSQFGYVLDLLAFSHSESWVVVCSSSRLLLYDRAQRTLLRDFHLPTSQYLEEIAVSFDDQKIAVCDQQQIWIIDVPALFAGNPGSGQRPWTSFHISDDGRLIAYELGTKIEVWDATTSVILTSLAIGDIVDRIVPGKKFSPKGQYLAFRDTSSIFTWDLATTYLRKLSADCANNSLLAISDGNGNDGYWVAAAESSGISVWDNITGKRERSVKPYDGRLQAAAIAFANSRLGVLWYLKDLEHKAHVATFLLYNVETGEQLFRVDIPPFHGLEKWYGNLRLSTSRRLAIFESYIHEPSIIWECREEIYSAKVEHNMYNKNLTHMFFLDDSTVSTTK
ncbi:hypothetical protein IL306_011347 [Fusarium sp. DS 682]|nr:hypothetical protein IL306_011347 [Fusarium sp. DS 682]